VVLVQESNPPAGQPPVQWILITTLPIGTLEEVRRVVECYCVRWNIEILFKTLKSGCRIEQRRFEHVDRISRCLALYLIVAWRTLWVCRMGRELPEADCELLFEPSEWKAVWTAVHRKNPPQKETAVGRDGPSHRAAGRLRKASQQRAWPADDMDRTAANVRLDVGLGRFRP
jgi:hypothetical protein